MLITILTLIFAASFFAWGKIRSDVVALIALITLSVSGILTTEESLSGFSNSIVIMMIGLFVVGGAIFQTGLAKMIGARLLSLAGNSEIKLFLLVVGVTSIIGAFVSNTGTVALMLPIVASIAKTSGIGTSRFLMPMAFASSMGGMMTLIGTPPNLVIEETLTNAGFERLTFFSFLPAGSICLIIGTLLLIPLSKWFLRKKNLTSSESSGSKSISQLVEECDLHANMERIIIPRNSDAIGKTIGQLHLRSKYNIQVFEVRSDSRQGRLLGNISQKAANANTILQENDIMFLSGEKNAITQFIHDFSLKYAPDDDRQKDLAFYDIGIAEIVLMPSSQIVNRTIADIGFSNHYNVNIVGIRRKSQYIRKDISSQKIHPEDVLLVQGTWDNINELTKETNDWVVLGQPLTEASKVTLNHKAPIAALIMLAMIATMVFDFIPISPVISVISAAILMVLTGCFRNVEAAYKTINWESVVLIGAMMPLSLALEKTGASHWVSQSLVSSLGNWGPLALMAGIYFTTSLMTMFISNTATAVLLAPIALESALALGVSPIPFLFAVSFGASLCFASPFSTPPNALVMPAGQYSFMDYIKVGVPLQLILGIVMILVLPLIFPF